MLYTSFGPLGRPVSRLGFGCAPMGSRYGKRESLRALGEAFDRGVTYFDVARSYGYGDAEGILGSFIRDKRDRVIVATKFGIEPPASTPARRFAKAVARRLFHVAPGLRRAARRSLGAQFARPPFDPERAAKSLEQSLRALRSDRIDVLLVHDCSPRWLADERVFAFLDRALQSGKVACVGVSGDRSVVADAIGSHPRLTVAQFRHDVFTPYDDGLRSSHRLAAIGYHPFGGEAGTGPLLRALQSAQNDDTAPGELRRKLREVDPDEAVTALALSIVRGDSPSVVLATMFQRRHIDANAAALDSSLFLDDDLRYLRTVAQTARG
jgi:aryl-alcohol dehydrogenase-like predicted oxidoreductase